MDKKKIVKALKYINSWLDLRYRRNEWPGFVVAISLKGKIIFNKAYGFADLEKKEKLTPQHIFRIASHSKTFTATAILQLVEKNKLQLDDCIVKYLPWLKDHKDKRFQKITIRQLLSHGAGVIRDGLNSDYWQLKRSFPTREELRKEILEAELVLNPNKQLKYSNYGYSLLGLIIETVSTKSYYEYIIDKIIKPLNLSNTGPDLLDETKDKLVTGYSRPDIKKKRIPIANIKTNAMSSATGFYSTSKDLSIYYNALMPGSGKLLTDESKKEMQKTYWRVKNSKEKDKYGLGLVVYSVKGKEFFGHGGGFPGHATKTFYNPKNQIVICVLMNYIDGEAGLAGRGIISILDYFQKHYSSKKLQDSSKFEERFMNLWSITDVISMGDKSISFYPDSWSPLEEIEKLKFIDNKTLKIESTHGFYSEGELIHYNFEKNGKIKSIIYAGAAMLPEKDYLAALEKITVIEQK